MLPESTVHPVAGITSAPLIVTVSPGIALERDGRRGRARGPEGHRLAVDAGPDDDSVARLDHAGRLADGEERDAPGPSPRSSRSRSSPRNTRGRPAIRHPSTSRRRPRHCLRRLQRCRPRRRRRAGWRRPCHPPRRPVRWRHRPPSSCRRITPSPSGATEESRCRARREAHAEEDARGGRGPGDETEARGHRGRAPATAAPFVLAARVHPAGRGALRRTIRASSRPIQRDGRA